MDIHVVQPGETLASIANQYGVTQNRLITDNELPNPDNLVVGQSIAVLYTEVTHTVVAGDTLYGIAEAYDVTPTQILQNNPWISEEEGLVPGQLVVIRFRKDENFGNITINGYAYPFIDRTVLRKTLPFLTYLSIFNYGFTPEGELIPADDEELIQIADDFGVGSLLVLAPMNAQGTFSSELAHEMFINTEGQNQLIQNILTTLGQKGYRGVDIDFEYVLPEDRESFINFIRNMKNALAPAGYILTVALAPKTSGEQPGLLYQAHDYPTIGAIADLVLLMTYEWGYTFGPPMATSPLASVRRVLEYGVSVIDPDKILMGMPNYAYDWPLPFIRGQTKAENISNVQAIERAAQFGVTIQFDEPAQAPFYYYTSEEGAAHVVWFDDVRSMNAKYRLIPEYNLHGVGVWQIMNFFPQSWLVVNNLFTVTKV
ncbi:LysM peptidoglycan-binding domain-containing protein [Anaerocolumna sedimenticola]|uniref:LysM peptidoglycan-binding domain-containing protein n=1 Tax=Anaerocolumna sedimenticola TaxID=2696063 RepID=A0A6P1TPI7_9FIRM|nr:glycosyl hydrolase family 18 protein [Anaerocolumna sedimenticola]QHQ61716.1 LysM peptidoglycan-binding domain-containing protein [Anaerocolumna sedimenticola]